VDGGTTAGGFPAGRIPVTERAEVASGRRSVLHVAGAGACHTAVAPLAGRTSGHLMVARAGAEGFNIDEMGLIRGMARVLELTLETLRTLAAERRQAAENSRLLTTLQKRHRLLEQLSA